MFVFSLFIIFANGIEMEKFLNFSSSSSSSEDYSDVSEATESYSNSGEPDEKGMRPDRISDDEKINRKSPYCQKCEKFDGVCIEDNVDSSFDSNSDDEDETVKMICSCKYMECDPDFLEGIVAEPVCDQNQVKYESLCLLRLTRCTKQEEIIKTDCRGKPTRIVVYSKNEEDYISSYSENPLDFYETDDFEEVVLPKTTTGRTTTTEKIVTTEEADKGVPPKDKTLAIVIGIVEGLAFLTLVAVLTVSCYLAREAKMNGHQPLESVETAPLTEVKAKKTKVSTIDSSI